MPFVYNFPFFSIFLCMVSAILLSVSKNRRFNYCWTLFVSMACTVLSAVLLVRLMASGESFAYTMGKFPAPFGNEIKAGPLQALFAACFSFVMFFSILGGKDDLFRDVPERKYGLACVMQCMTLASLLVLTYTNDIFTGYVFIEISTIAACALVMIRDESETLISTIRYLFMSLLGSGLFLFGVVILYGITGHLLMPQLSEKISGLVSSGSNKAQLAASLAMITIGLGVKSGMYPFHRWLPWAHGTATTSSSAILSGLVLKGYVVLLITVYCRVFTLDVVREIGVNYIVFALGLLEMIVASLYAMKQSNIKHMLAYSSVAQLGYIFMGIGLGTEAGVAAACFQVIAHACTKSLLFCTAGRLDGVTDFNKELRALRGSARRAPLAGIAFGVGALSMIGIPLFAGFTSKMNFALAEDGWKSILMLAALVISSVLNAMYYLPAVLSIWAESDAKVTWEYEKKDVFYGIAAIVLIAAVVALGTCFAPVMKVIEAGLGLM